MDKNKVLATIKNVREISKKRNFDQTFDLIINFKDLDLKKSNLDVFLTLPFPKGQAKVCGLVGKELVKQAEEHCDEVVVEEDFKKYSDKKLIKNLAKNYDFFVAQANLMGKIATVFGRVLGPLGKMPNPKLGGVVPETIPSMKPIVDKFRKSVRLMAKKEPIIKTSIGKESMKDEEVYENFHSVYDNIIQGLPKAEHNVKNVLIKLTMSKPVKVGEEVKKEKEEEKSKVEEKKKVKEEKVSEKEKKEIKIENKEESKKKEIKKKKKEIKTEDKK